MNQWTKRVVAFSAIIFINFNAMLYFYRRSQFDKNLGSPVQSPDNNVIRALHDGQNEATSGFLLSSGLNNDSASNLNSGNSMPGQKSKYSNDVVTSKPGDKLSFVSSDEYRNLLQNLPSDDKMMQTILGLVIDTANQSRRGIGAFRELLELANTTEVRKKYSQYTIKHSPQSTIPILNNNQVGNKQVSRSAPSPNIKKNKNDNRVKARLTGKNQIEIQEPPKYEVEQLIFEPIKSKYGASEFNMYHAFEPEYFSNLKPTIPHIIHQTWDSYNIPGVFKPWIRSILEKHQDWDYWFWTPKDVECLLTKRYPKQYLDTYRKYNAMIFKSDFLRYFLLYEFGGFYIDLDVEAFHPLDFWTYKHQCVMSHENYEHTYLLHNRKQPNVMTTIIGSRPQHPYFKLLQENLPAYQRRFARDVLKATGPFYLNEIYQKYIQTNLTEQAANEITVIHPRYWLPKYDYRLTNKLRQSCRLLQPRLPQQGKELCQDLTRRGFNNRIKPDSFLDHHWTHVNMWKGNQKGQDLFNLFTEFPQAKRASDILQCP